MSMLSTRGTETIETLDLPWKFAPKGNYSQENPSGLIAFASAENVLVTEEVLEFIKKVELTAQDFLYSESAGYGLRFHRALATHLNEYLKSYESITCEEIKVTVAATAIHDILAWAVANPGDAILTSRPVYGRFEMDFWNKSQVKVAYADTNETNCLEETVVDKFEEALVQSDAQGARIRAVLIVNPNNPLGKCYPASTIVNVMKFCQKHRLHLISDEIYACSVFDSGDPSATPFTSALSIDSKNLIDPDLLHVTYGMSKDFGAGGLRLGAIITRSKSIHRAVETAMPFTDPSGPSLAIGAAMLEDREWCRTYMRGMRGKLAKAYEHVTSGLREMGVEYLPGGNAGFFIYVNFSPYLPEDLNGEENAEFALARKFLDAGVFLHPREEHSSTPGWFRVVYTHDPRKVTEGLKRIKSVIS